MATKTFKIKGYVVTWEDNYAVDFDTVRIKVGENKHSDCQLTFVGEESSLFVCSKEKLDFLYNFLKTLDKNQPISVSPFELFLATHSSDGKEHRFGYLDIYQCIGDLSIHTDNQNFRKFLAALREFCEEAASATQG